ncbi:MAG: maleylacetoacetate isomerase [Rhizobiaceae bacterium]
MTDGQPKLTLYSYFRSSAAYRVRIALNLKGIAYDIAPVHLIRDGGQHRSPWYEAINPQKRVPALVIDEDGRSTTLVQSPAIIEWIEEAFPSPPLLPVDRLERARVRAVAAIVACDIHPLNNLSTLDALRDRFDASEGQRKEWIGSWVTQGFEAIETLMTGTPFAFGEAPGLADVYLVPQVFNARRFEVDLTAFPKIVATAAACAQVAAFQDAAPDRQPDGG